MTHARVLLALSATLIFATVALADPCVLKPTFGNAFVGKPEQLAACFNQVPFQQQQALDTMDSLNSLADLYSFTDMSKDSGAPYNLKVDLRGTLAQIKSKVQAKSYTNDYQFQSDLMNLFNPLFDAHTLYMAPSGYQCFLLRPFNLEASVDASTNSMVYNLREGPLGANTAAIWKQVFGVDISPFVNSVVTSINDMTPTDHVMKVAEHFISTYKDHGVRYNAALRGRWSQTVLSMFPLNDPNMDFSMKIKLASGATINVPNAAFCGGGGITSTSGLLGKNKGSALDMTASQLADQISELNKRHPMIEGKDIYREMEEMFEEAVKSSHIDVRPTLRRDVVIPAASPVTVHDYRPLKQKIGREFASTTGQFVPTRTIPVENFDPSALRIMKQSSAGDTIFMIYDDHKSPVHYVLKLTTFAPNSTSETLDVIQTMIKTGQQNNVKHLIMDVAYNGGGIICLSDLLLALLVPNWVSLQPGASPTLPYGIYDFRQSPSSDAIRANRQLDSIFTSYTGYLDIQTEKIYTNASFYNPIHRTRGGLSSPYTQQAYFPAECIGYPGGNFRAIPYYFEHIDVLTDGTCGSACALFCSQLQSYHYARVVSYGGPLGRQIPLSTASFAGGNVLEYNMVSMYAWYYGSGSKGLPPMMSSSARARFNFNEYYEYDTLETPREFLKRPADVHLDYYAALYNDNVNTPVGFANSGRLYGALVAL